MSLCLSSVFICMFIYSLSNRLHSLQRWKFSKRTEKLPPLMNKIKLRQLQYLYVYVPCIIN